MTEPTKDPELAEEQAYVTAAYARLEAMREAAERVRAAYSDVRAGGTHQARLETAEAVAVGPLQRLERRPRLAGRRHVLPRLVADRARRRRRPGRGDLRAAGRAGRHGIIVTRSRSFMPPY